MRCQTAQIQLVNEDKIQCHTHTYRSIIQWFAKDFPNYRHLQNLHSEKGASRTRGLGGRVRHEMSRSKIISRQWPLVVHLSRGLVGWSQVVWLGNGHKAVTVQGPRRPLLRSVLNPYLGTPATTTSGWPAPHQLSNISNHCPKKTNFSIYCPTKTRMLSKLLFLSVSLVAGQDLNLCKYRFFLCFDNKYQHL